VTLSLSRRALLFLGLGATLTLPVLADEGMWTFDNPPRQRLKEAYGFEPSQEWLDKVRLASVRFMDGGSGSFSRCRRRASHSAILAS